MWHTYELFIQSFDFSTQSIRLHLTDFEKIVLIFELEKVHFKSKKNDWVGVIDRRFTCFAINTNKESNWNSYTTFTFIYEENLQATIRVRSIEKYSLIFFYLYLLIDFNMSTTASSSTEICDGDNLAIILALYWVVSKMLNFRVIRAKTKEI